jgi:hypothetical protein
MILELVATLCAGLFAGAALYINIAEHPARLEVGPSVALREFGPSYRRAAVMQASLALVGLVAAVAAWWTEGHGMMLVGGLLLGAVVPFTLLAIKGTNKRLMAPDLDPDSAEARALLVRWGRLHAVRTVLSVLGFATLAACVVMT